MANRPNNNEADNKSNEQPQVTQSSGSLPGYYTATLRISSSYPTGANRVDTNVLPAPYESPTEAPFQSTKPTPGILCCNFLPTLGISKSGDADSALNRATANEFNAIRCQISGNRSYQPSDHMIYRVCVDSIRDLYTYAKRIYAIVRKYSATNLYKPRAVLRAMGLDADDWINNTADLYQWLLDHAESLKPYPTVPIGNMTDRHNVYNSTLFCDGDGEESQIYIMNQIAFWSYEKVDTVKGLSLRRTPRTFAEFKNTWNAMFNALATSSDVYTIASDIRRAFEDRVVTSMTPPTENDSVQYVNLDAIKYAIMNSESVNIVSTPLYDITAVLTQFRIEDDDATGLLRCQPVIPKEYTIYTEGESANKTAFATSIGHCAHINVFDSNPSDEIMANAMRLKPVISITRNPISDDDTTWGNTCTIEVMGTELITSYTMVCDPNGDDSEVFHFGNYVIVSLDDAYNTVPMTTRFASRLSSFDWHPVVGMLFGASINRGMNVKYLVSYDYGNVQESVRFLEDVQNYIPLSDSQLRMYHDASLLREFGVQ